jgi:hypothetical protein
MFATKEHHPQSPDPVRGPAPSPAPAQIPARFEQERENASFILNTLRTFFLAPKLQPPHSQRLAHSFTQARKLTPAFPATSPLFVRSFAKERKSTPLFSCISALFREKCRGTQNSGRFLTVNFLYHFPFRNTPETSPIAANSAPERTSRFRGELLGPCRPRREALRSIWARFAGKQVPIALAARPGSRARRAR